MANPYDDIDPPTPPSELRRTGPPGTSDKGDKVDRFVDRIGKLEGSAPSAVSPKGAVSRYQITKATADTYGLDYERLKHDDGYAHESARTIATDLNRRFAGDTQTMAAAWNGGPGVGQDFIRGGKKAQALPSETQLYIAHNTAEDGGNPYDFLDPGEKPAADYQKAGARSRTPLAPARYSDPNEQAEARLAKAPPGQTEMRAAPGGLEQAWGNVKAGFERGAGPDFQAALREPNSMLSLADLTNSAFGGVQGAAEQSVGRLFTAPTAGKPGTDPRQTDATRHAAGLLVSALVPVPGGPEVKIPEQIAKDLVERVGTSPIDKVVAQAAKQSDPEYAAAAGRLLKDGVPLTRGQTLGGHAKAWWDRATSNPLIGDAVTQAQRESMEGFNTAYAQRTLRNIGVQLKNPKAGTDLVANTRQAISAYYERQLPKARLSDDGQLEEAFQGALAKTGQLPNRGTYGSALKAFWEGNVKQFLKDGQMDGAAYKRAETELSKKIASYKNATGAEREYGGILSDLRDALRAGLERGSPPNVSANLKRANRAWAMYKLMEDAAATSQVGRGIFTPGQLLGAIRKSGGRSSFAQGEGLAQGFASDAQRVIGDHYPDPGTAGRNAQNNFGRAAGAGLGASVGGPGGAVVGEMLGGQVGGMATGVTNKLAGHMLRAHTQRLIEAGVKPGAPGVRNYLAEARGRLGRGVAPAVTARNALVGQGQQ